MWAKVKLAIAQHDPRQALDDIWQVVTRANQFVEERKPWVLAKDESKKGELAETLVILGESMARIAYMLIPFLPATASQILTRMKLPPDTIFPKEEVFKNLNVPRNIPLERGEALFPKMEE